MEKALEQQPSACLKIVLYGPESTGKTTLAKRLAEYFDVPWVAEYMREYLQQKWDGNNERISKDDLIPIARGQLEAENAAALKTNSYLFCDTNLLELKVYSEYYYNGYCPELIRQSVNNSHYDLYLLMAPDIPWAPDDLRDLPHDRLGIFRIFEDELKARGLSYVTISGNANERMERAIAVIENLQPNRCLTTKT